MHVSVIEPVGPAVQRAQRMLFGPFVIEKWLGLGFCAFLANLASEGGAGGMNFSGFGNTGGAAPAGQGGGFDDALESLRDYWPWIVLGALCVTSLFIAVGMLLTWLSSRGQFMFIDGVARNRGGVVEPWREFRAEGNSLFFFRFWFGLATFFAFLLCAGLCALLAWPDVRAERFGPMALLALVLGVGSLVVLSIVAGCVRVFLLHFVAPIMYARRLRVGAAWSEFGRVMLREYKGTLLLYLLFQIVLGMLIGILTVLATCATCCLAAIPYLGTVILLPLHVFGRAYPIYFLEQFGPEWRILQPIGGESER